MVSHFTLIMNDDLTPLDSTRLSSTSHPPPPHTHSSGVKPDLAKYPSKLEEDYADYVYVDDFNRYRTLKLEAEEADNSLGPVAPYSLKPQPFYGIRRPPRHKVEPKSLPTRLEHVPDYDIISHLPKPQKQHEHQPRHHKDDRNGVFPFSVSGTKKHGANGDKKDFRRKVTILLPANEQFKRNGTRTWMDED